MSKLRIPKWARNAADDYVSSLWNHSARSFKAQQKQRLAETIAVHYQSQQHRPLVEVLDEEISSSTTAK